jgi:transposase
MYIRQCFRTVQGERRAYWALVESVRTERGPRQNVIAWLGTIDEAGRLGVQQAAIAQMQCGVSQQADSNQAQLPLFEFEDEQVQPRWLRVNANAVRVENIRAFGGSWLALQLIKELQLDVFLNTHLPAGRERVQWSVTAMILVIARLLDPSSELYVAEQWYPKTALPDLIGVPIDRVDDNRLYRALDKLLPHKDALEIHLKNRMGELFDLEYDLLLYDVTSTYFEGQCKGNPLAQRGYSRDQRSDCKQVCIALVVSRCGMPVGYEIFAGNTADVTTVEDIVNLMEKRYGKSDRIWVMDRGMTSEENLEFLRQENRRYIIGTPKSMLKNFERELLKKDWTTIRDGIEVKLCTMPKETEDESSDESTETFILCRSRDRKEKDKAIVKRAADKIAERLAAMQARCEKQNRDRLIVSREIGRLLGQNTRASHLFEVNVFTKNHPSADEKESTKDKQSKQGKQPKQGKEYARIEWKRIKRASDWHELSDGCYLLRSNVRDWTEAELWRAYIQLTEAENAFRIHKSDLRLRPVWHQKEDRVKAHILVCFISYVLWKMLAQKCKLAGLGDEPRRVLSELSEIRLVDVVLPTEGGLEIRNRCVARPSEHQRILLEKLGLRLPTRIRVGQM